MHRNANWYGQALYDPNSPYWLGEGETYPGIYEQSQEVATTQRDAAKGLLNGVGVSNGAAREN